MKTAISIPDDLFEAADRVAKRLGLSRSEFYQRAIAKYLEGQSDSAVTAQLNTVYRAEGADRVDPVLDALQWGSIVREEW
jgi:metal-responsive CopG/Arc/MetJ family transcriptional regulator